MDGKAQQQRMSAITARSFHFGIGKYLEVKIKKKELKCYVKKCVVSTCGVAKIGQPRKNKRTKLDSSE